MPKLFIFFFVFIIAGAVFLANRQNAFDEKAKVGRVIDGDTFVLANGSHVRMIGFDAPEKKEALGPMATECLKKYILGKEVRLEKDVESTDHYGRLLYYVYSGGLFVNLEIVRAGCASAFPYAPNLKYSEQFAQAEEEAKEAQRGIWAEN